MEKNGQPFRELQIPRVFLKRSKGTKGTKFVQISWTLDVVVPIAKNGWH
jgi:hypothetical protein